jgi:hypothetical protein
MMKLMLNCENYAALVRGSFHFLPSKLEMTSGYATGAVGLAMITA